MAARKRARPREAEAGADAVDALRQPLAVLLGAVCDASGPALLEWAPKDVGRAGQWAQLVQDVFQSAAEDKLPLLAAVLARARAGLGPPRDLQASPADMCGARALLFERILCSPVLPQHPQSLALFRAAAAELARESPQALLSLCAGLASRRASTRLLLDALAVLGAVAPTDGRRYWLLPETVQRRGAAQLLLQRASVVANQAEFLAALDAHASASAPCLETAMLAALQQHADAPEDSQDSQGAQAWLLQRLPQYDCFKRGWAGLPDALVVELAHAAPAVVGERVVAARVAAVCGAAARLDVDGAQAAAERLAAVRARGPQLAAMVGNAVALLSHGARLEPFLSGLLTSSEYPRQK